LVLRVHFLNIRCFLDAAARIWSYLPFLTHQLLCDFIPRTFPLALAFFFLLLFSPSTFISMFYCLFRVQISFGKRASRRT
jgi:hypothetical protein